MQRSRRRVGSRDRSLRRTPTEITGSRNRRDTPLMNPPDGSERVASDVSALLLGPCCWLKRRRMSQASLRIIVHLFLTLWALGLRIMGARYVRGILERSVGDIHKVVSRGFCVWRLRLQGLFHTRLLCDWQLVRQTYSVGRGGDCLTKMHRKTTMRGYPLKTSPGVQKCFA